MQKNRFNASTTTDSNPSQPSAKANAISIDNDADKVAITSVPILMYHYIRDYTDQSDPTGLNLSVSPSIFDQQMSYLAQNNFQTISPSQMSDGFLGKYKISNNKRPIVITFDDGYADAYMAAYPILKKYNFSATFYIITGQVGQSERMTSGQIIDLYKNGMNIGSHTVSHLNLPSLPADELQRQLADSKQYLEQLLGHKIYDFCYPSGKFDDNVMVNLNALGYKTATTTKNGIPDLNANIFELPRIRVQNSTNLSKVLN